MKPLKTITRIIILLCGLAMIPSNYVSVWQIQLEAPQYPEGLKMEIWSHKIAGDIDKINGLNHYIGMSLIKEENFPEFKIMPWMIWGFVLLGMLTAAVGKKFMLWIYTSYWSPAASGGCMISGIGNMNMVIIWILMLQSKFPEWLISRHYLDGKNYLIF
jgi:hypothetical protein